MLKFPALLACGLLAVAGCSSSNGDPAASANVLEDVVENVDSEQLASATRLAARATPRSGSVTQSANTSDTITVGVDGSGEYMVTNTRSGSARWSVGSDDVVETVDGDQIFSTTEGTGTGTRTVYVGLLLDQGIGGDEDYLAYGLWADVPETGVPEIGVFVDSNDGARFTQGNLLALEGDATYRGPGQANGIYTEGGEISSFIGDVVLTAAFGDENGLGTVTGTISNLRDIHDNVDEDSTINLGSATITDTGPGGFFTGPTTSTLNINGVDDSFTGRWGGQFFVDGDAANPYPEDVAGTFGLANTGNTRSFLGLFRAQLDDDS